MSLKESIKQIQKRERITQDELLRRLGVSRASLIGNATPEAETALKLAFGSNGKNNIDNIHNSKGLEKFLPWVRKFPIRALQNMGLLPTNIKGTELVRAVFRFMQIGSIEGFNSYYSTTLQSTNPQTIAAWIRLGELQIERSNNEFTPDHDAILSNLKFLRTNAFFLGQNLRKIAREALSNCGIELIEVQPFLTAPTPTCAFYWRGYCPVIQFPTTKMDDSRFLEALFHAVAHVLYHPLRTCCMQLGDRASMQQSPAQPKNSKSKDSNTFAQSNAATTAKSALEIEAETFAQDMLLSEAEECELICCGRFSEPRCIQHFSRLFHVRPGILIERLQQQDKISRRTPLNDFKIAV